MGLPVLILILPLGDKGQAQSNQQATNDKGQKIYIDSHGNETTEAGTQENPHTAKLATGMASLQVGSNIGYGSDSERSSSITKAGINTQNIEIRNKEAQQQLTGKSVEETLHAIRINTNTDNAESLSGKLDNHFDKNNVQRELNYQVKVMEDFQKVTLASIDTQMASHAENKREAANQAREEGKLAQAQVLEQEAKDWEMGGKYKQAVDSVTNAVGLFLGGKGIEGAAVGAASPYINNKIKEATQGNEEVNLVAHALWGAVETYSQGGKAGTGAIAAVTGEAGAKVIAENLYGKSAENLTETEKRTVSELSQVAAGLASGLSSSGGDSYTALTTAQTGKAAAENAVENNHFADDIYPMEDRKQTIEMMAKAMFEGNLDKAEEYYEHHENEIKKFQLQEYLAIFLTKGIPQVTTGSTLIAGSFGGGSEFVGQLIEHNGEISKVDRAKIGISALTGIVTKDMGVFKTALTNSGVEVLDSFRTNENPWVKGGTSFGTTLVGGYAGKSFENKLNGIINPTWKIKYSDKSGHLPYGISESYKPSYVPSVIGNSADGITSKGIEKPVESLMNNVVDSINGEKNE